MRILRNEIYHDKVFKLFVNRVVIPFQPAAIHRNRLLFIQ